MGRLIIDGNSVYEIDEECEMRKREQVGATDENFSGGTGWARTAGKSTADGKKRRTAGTVGNKG
mgnify:CR=1 FL=1